MNIYAQIVTQTLKCFRRSRQHKTPKSSARIAIAAPMCANCFPCLRRNVPVTVNLVMDLIGVNQPGDAAVAALAVAEVTLKNNSFT